MDRMGRFDKTESSIRTGVLRLRTERRMMFIMKNLEEYFTRVLIISKQVRNK
jgi:hypothetical protein